MKIKKIVGVLLVIALVLCSTGVATAKEYKKQNEGDCRCHSGTTAMSIAINGPDYDTVEGFICEGIPDQDIDGTCNPLPEGDISHKY